MKINMSMDRYDIGSLEEVYSISNSLKEDAGVLEILGKTLKSRLVTAEEEFSTINYNRVKEATEDYLQKMRMMKEELTELSQSCKQFAEKIHLIWS